MSSLPSGWTVKPLGDVATLQRGFDLPVQQRVSGNVPIFAANGPVGTHIAAKVKGPGVVTGRSGTLGEVHYVESDYWPLNTALWVKDFHGNDPRWIARLLKWMRLETHTRGTGVPTLNRNLVHVVPVLVPPIAQQRRIADILDRADAVRRKRQQAIALTEELLRSALLEMFGDPIINSKKWDMARFDEIGIQIIDGDRGKAYPSADQFSNDGFCLFLSTKNVTKWGFEFTECNFISEEKDSQLRKGKLQQGDVILTTRGTLGNVAYYDLTVPYEHIRINSGMVIFRVDPKSVNSQFLYYLLRSQFFNMQVQKASSGSAQPQLPIRTISNFKIPVPKLEQQEQFGLRLFSIEKQRMQYSRNFSITDSLFTSLLQRAFRGEL